MKVTRKKVVYVQPLPTPYNIPRLAALARDPELEIVVLWEADCFPDRPDWTISSIPGCTVEVVGSQSIIEQVSHPDLDYDVTGIRYIPWKLPFALHRHRPDIVVVCNATELCFALVAKLFGRFKIVMNVEDTRHSTRNVSGVVAYIKRWVYRRANVHLAFSEQTVQYLRSIGINKSIARTSWSVDLETFGRNDMRRKAIRSQLGLVTPAIFLFVGRIISLKGVMPLLRAWASLSPDIRSHAALVLVGDGPQEVEARRFAKDHNLEEVRFVGHRPYDELPAYYSAADLLIFPTLQDVWGLVVLEAMASSCAVMTTQYSGASYLVEEGLNGWLFDSADETSIRNHLTKAIAARRELPAMGARARSSVQRLDTVAVMNSLAKMLKSL